MVSLPIGGRKNMLNPSAAATDATVASARPHHAEIPRMANSRLSATVVWFTASAVRYSARIPATIAIDPANRNALIGAL